MYHNKYISLYCVTALATDKELCFQTTLIAVNKQVHTDIINTPAAISGFSSDETNLLQLKKGLLQNVDYQQVNQCGYIHNKVSSSYLQ